MERERKARQFYQWLSAELDLYFLDAVVDVKY